MDIGGCLATGGLVVKKILSSSQGLVQFSSTAHFSSLFIPTNIDLDISRLFLSSTLFGWEFHSVMSFSGPIIAFPISYQRKSAVTYPISDLRKWIVAKYTPKPGTQRCNACEKRGEERRREEKRGEERRNDTGNGAE